MSCDNGKHITVITPTTGSLGLLKLIDSIKIQGFKIVHILLWDKKRSVDAKFVRNELGIQDCNVNISNKYICANYKFVNIDIDHYMNFGLAKGSALRSIGLMTAFTNWVTFADDDVTWDSNHLLTFMNALGDRNWVFCKRKIWAKKNNDTNCLDFIGIDDFESVGDSSVLPYKMVDNNCILFKRELGVYAAHLYRQTLQYNDDRLMYNFLVRNAGLPAKTFSATINQVCPKRLECFFRLNCTKVSH